MLKKQELRVFSYLEIPLSGRHLPLRLSGSFPFRLPFPSSLNQLASGFNSRLDKPCTNSREYLRLKNSLPDNAISSGKSRGITPKNNDKDGADLREPKAKANSYGCEIVCRHKTTNHVLGESLGKNDTRR
jgi:hypothetical protein